MTLSGRAVRRIRQAFNAATAMPIDEATFAARFGIPTNSEIEGVNGGGARALRYLSQGLPGFRGNLSEWSFNAHRPRQARQGPLPTLVAALRGPNNRRPRTCAAWSGFLDR